MSQNNYCAAAVAYRPTFDVITTISSSLQLRLQPSSILAHRTITHSAFRITAGRSLSLTAASTAIPVNLSFFEKVYKQNFTFQVQHGPVTFGRPSRRPEGSKNL